MKRKHIDIHEISDLLHRAPTPKKAKAVSATSNPKKAKAVSATSNPKKAKAVSATSNPRWVSRQSTNPDKFASNPFGSGSVYFDTHIPPKEGCRVLELTRDKLASRSWGLEFCYDYFLGGACLVTNIEPDSPAEAAVDIGSSHVSNITEQQPFSCLKKNDIILCINGKKVDGMTELELATGLDMCGEDVIIVVAPYRHGAGVAIQS